MALCAKLCSDGGRKAVSLIALSASDKAGTTSVIEQMMRVYDPAVNVDGTQAASLPPQPTIAYFEEYSFLCNSLDADQESSVNSSSVQAEASVRIDITEFGRAARAEILNLTCTAAPSRLDGADSSHSLKTGGTTVATSTDSFGMPFTNKTRGELIRKLRKCDAVVVVVDSAERAVQNSSSSFSGTCRNADGMEELSAGQIEMFVGLRRCFAEMVAGSGVASSAGSGTFGSNLTSSSSTFDSLLSRGKVARRKSYPVMCVIANKQDRAGALSAQRVAQQLGLSAAPPTSLKESMSWVCLPCVANNDRFHAHHVMESIALLLARRSASAISPEVQHYTSHDTGGVQDDSQSTPLPSPLAAAVPYLLAGAHLDDDAHSEATVTALLRPSDSGRGSSKRRPTRSTNR